MTKLEILELVILAIIALSIALYYVIKAVRNGWIDKLTLTINDAIRYAEDNIEKGKKKEYVLGKVEEKCVELDIPYTLIYKLLNKVIDKIIAHYNIIKKGK